MTQLAFWSRKARTSAFSSSRGRSTQPGSQCTLSKCSTGTPYAAPSRAASVDLPLPLYPITAMRMELSLPLNGKKDKPCVPVVWRAVSGRGSLPSSRRAGACPLYCSTARGAKQVPESGNSD